MRAMIALDTSSRGGPDDGLAGWWPELAKVPRPGLLQVQTRADATRRELDTVVAEAQRLNDSTAGMEAELAQASLSERAQAEDRLANLRKVLARAPAMESETRKRATF